MLLVKLSVKQKCDRYPFCANNSGIIKNSNNVLEYNNQDMSSDVQDMKNVIEIHSVEQLIEISRQINLGDPFYYKGNYRLVVDLDLQGKKWIPMGINEMHPFSGIFDGNDCSIKNVFVQGNKNSCTGFFGYLKNASIYNVSVEGIMKGGKYLGAIAGVNDNSNIYACFASAKVCGNYNTGGFIGKNSGKISHCYFSGTVQYNTIAIIHRSNKNSTENTLCLK